MKTVTRRTKFTGQRVTVEFKDGSTVTGSMVGWGSQVMTVAPDEGQQLEGQAARECNGWKRESFWVGKVARVWEA